MRAAQIHSYGAPEVLTVDTVADPEPGPRDVLVDVHAASVNPIDWKIRSGGQRAIIHYRLPFILGLDFSGVVVAVGAKVTRFAVGDEVYGSPTHRRPGTYAEMLAVDEREIAKKPARLSHQEAAALPLAALTAWNALITKGKMKRGDRVLIHAGSGGVGTVAIQLAKAHGAFVATTCSGRNADLVQSLGADQVVNYREQRFEDELQGFDIVLDAIGGETRERSFAVLRRGGRLATMIGGFPAATLEHGVVRGPIIALSGLVSLMTRGLLVHGVWVRNVLRPCDGRLLEKITDLVEAGDLRPVVDRVFPLDEIVAAHEYSETHRARGKIVIQIR